MKRIRIGTRASKLAMTQTSRVSAQLRQRWPDLEIEIEQIRTTGDRVTNVPLTQIGGDGVFVTEIERALRERRIDLAVHSLKDLPTEQPEGLCVVVGGPREDVRDVLIASRAVHLDVQGFETEALRIGTGSLRRIAQLRFLAPHIQTLPIRGNVDTRLRKLAEGEYDGIVLAAAGLHRLGLQEQLQEQLTYFPVEIVLPAPGQGALGLECREEAILELLAPLCDEEAQAATRAERMFMRHLGAGCYLPVAAYGQVLDGQLQLDGLVSSLDGQRRIRVQQQVAWSGAQEQAEQLGVRLAEQALAQGAAEIVQELNVLREQQYV